MFKATIITPKGILFEGEAWSVFLPGAAGEFEVLEFHKSIISLLREGRIIIDCDKEISIKKGVVKMEKEHLVAIVEE